MRARGRRDTVALLGLRCAGKTTVGRLLAAELGRPFVDQDDETLRFARYSGWRAGSVGELLERAGEARFRELEAAGLKRLIEPSPHVVLATGGGAVERADNRAWLERAARCVYLAVPLEVLAARRLADPTARPPLGGAEPLAELAERLARREPHYRALAEHVVDGDAPPAEVVLRVAAALAAPA